jgi:hypothetical protein
MTRLLVMLRALKTWAPIKEESGQAALVIITTVVIAAGVAISQTSLMNSKRGLQVEQSLRANFDLVQAAIEVYAIQDTGSGSSGTYLLPCPADPSTNNGVARTYNGTGSNECSGGNNRGIVPWSTIGLAESDVIDANGNYLTYIVHSTAVAACNGTSAATDSLADTNGGSNVAYALVGHGTNGFGAYNNSSLVQVSAASASTNERDNCPTASGTCTPSTADGFRRGPASSIEDATFFDDIVKSVTFSETFTTECAELNKSTNEPLNAQAGFSRAETARNFVRTANDADQNANRFDSTRYDADCDSANGSEKEVLRFNSNDSFTSRACAYSEPTYPLQGYTIRQYAEVFFESTNTSTLGSGLVIGYFGHKTSGGAPTDVTRANPGSPYSAQPPCGGTDQYLGFGDENDAVTTAVSDAGNYTELAQPNDVFRFGLEIDTQTGFVDSGIEQQIFDPPNNHIAIVLGNNNHAGDETSATQPPNVGALSATNLNGPVCRDDMDGATITGDPGDSFGVDTTTRPTPYDRNVSASNGDLLQACYYRNIANDTWLEDGDPIDQNTISNDAYQQVRTELHWHGSNGCGANEIRFDAWVWNHANNDSCDTSTIDCIDLGSDYDDGTAASRRPHVSMCIAAEDVAGQNPMEALRFGFTSGLPSNGGGNGGEITIQRFGLNFERVDGISAKGYEGDNTESTDITEGEIRTALGAAGTGNLTLDQAYAHIAATGAVPDIRVFAERGKFYLDDSDFIGITGVSDQNLVSNISPTLNPFQLETTFLDIDKREKITIEFDDLYRKFTVNLRDFGSTDNTGASGYMGSLNEQVVLRAYNTKLAEGAQLVATETYRTCTLNGTSNGTASSMVISTDFGLTGSDYFDRVQIIPEPIDSTDITGETRFYVGAMKACGAGVNCAFDRSLVEIDADSDTEFRCVSFTPIAASTTGTGNSGEINPDLNSEFNHSNLNEDTDHAWLDFNNYPEDALDNDVMISAIGEIHSRDNANDETSGFGVNNSYGNVDRLDTVANPTGSETETETLIFHFEQRWNRLRIGFSRFGQQPNGGLDQAQVRLCDGGPTGTCETLSTVTACAGAGTQTN